MAQTRTTKKVHSRQADVAKTRTTAIKRKPPPAAKIKNAARPSVKPKRKPARYFRSILAKSVIDTAGVRITTKFVTVYKAVQSVIDVQRTRLPDNPYCKYWPFDLVQNGETWSYRQLYIAKKTQRIELLQKQLGERMVAPVYDAHSVLHKAARVILDALSAGKLKIRLVAPTGNTYGGDQLKEQYLITYTRRLIQTGAVPPKALKQQPPHKILVVTFEKASLDRLLKSLHPAPGRLSLESIDWIKAGLTELLALLPFGNYKYKDAIEVAGRIAELRDIKFEDLTFRRRVWRNFPSELKRGKDGRPRLEERGVTMTDIVDKFIDELAQRERAQSTAVVVGAKTRSL